MMSASGSWIPLMDYAVRKGVSLSTLRRYIKAKKVPFKIEEGRYLLFDSAEEKGFASEPIETQLRSDDSIDQKFQTLERELRKANEENAELKMLIALYEEKMFHQRLGS